MYSKFLFAGLVALFGALVWVGCGDEETCGCGDTTPAPDNVLIILGDDSLDFAAGDLASTTVTVVVLDGQGRPLAGQKVQFSLADPYLGVIELVDSLLQDTTNDEGHVHAIFRSYDRAGSQIVRACAAGVCDNAIITISSGTQPICNFRVEGCDTLYVHSTYADSCEFCATLFDCAGHGIPGVSLIVSSPPDITLPPTDSTGMSCVWWTPPSEGAFCFVVRVFHGFCDSTCVTVLPDTTN